MIETERRFTTASGQMAYLDEGDGPAVVLVHGFPASSFLWREFVPLLAGRSRVIVPDLLGSGDSTVSEGVSLDLRTQADAVAALLADLGVDRFAVVGHGVGGGVAQLLALDDLGADAMVLLDAVAFDAWPWPLLDAARQADVMSDADMEMSIRSSIEAGLPHGSRLPDAVLDGYVRPWRTGDGGARFAQVLAGLDGTGLAEREQELADIAFPVLILWGEDDPVLPPAVAERLNEAMPSSTLGLLPGCGHFLPEEAPATIGPMIAEYLRARFLMEPHGHDQKNGVVMLQLERRPPWVDLADDEADDWFDVETTEDTED